MKTMKYCESIYQSNRRKTREVLIGNIGVGANNPVRIQSMTTSSTRDIEATVDQAKKLVDAGCEIVRITVQGIKEADACENIKNLLVQSGYNVPLVADIHFYPPAAMRVIDFVDKVRINPGNFADKRASFKTIEYDDASYELELLKIEEKFYPLIEKCKRLKRAMRIGTNHGSLSDRIMNRYGDSPKGMLESALEFARLCRKYDYHDFLFSMKSSNPQVMIYAYRLLSAEMEKLGWDYPLHLGVTEAGLGEDGRIKSAMGIGSLLLDGIGDTIRVSLTEDPWHEIDPCKRLITFGQDYVGRGVDSFEEKYRDVENIKRRSVVLPKNLSLHRDGSVFVRAISSANDASVKNESELFKSLGCEVQLGRPKLTRTSVDGLMIESDKFDSKTLQALHDVGIGLFSEKSDSSNPVISLLSLSRAYDLHLQKASRDRFSINLGNDDGGAIALRLTNEPITDWDKILEIKPAVIFFSPKENYLHASRRFFEWLNEKGLKTPVILNFSYDCSKDDLVIRSAAECGALLCDGLGDGLWLEGPYEIDELRQLSFNILQAARMRIFKTDFISCPSCGRTLFDLQDVTKRIKSRTAHLAGVKIAIMGCIVNGPGEMADADFGYVGSKPGMIDLYVGKTCVEKDIRFAEADDRLIALIKTNGRWIDVLDA